MAIVNFNDLGKIGIIRDMEPNELPPNAWTKGNNDAFRDGIAQNIKGDTIVFGTPIGEPEQILPYPDPASAQFMWFYAGPSAAGGVRINEWNGLTHEDVTGQDIGSAYPAEGSLGWTSGSVAGVPYFNNGNNAPWVRLRSLNGVNLNPTFERIPDANWLPPGITARSAGMVRPFLNFYVLLDITETIGSTSVRNPSRLLWSDPAEPYLVPDNFDVSDATSLAGDIVLGDTSDYLIDALALRGSMIIYKRNETWQMRPVGGTQIFAFDRLFKDVGLLAPRCVTAFKGTNHIAVTNDLDIIMHNGNTKESVCDAKVRNAIFKEIDPENITRSFIAPHFQQEEIWYCYPTLGLTYCNRAAVWNYKSGAWSFRDLDNALDMKFGIANTNAVIADDTWDGGPDTAWGDGLGQLPDGANNVWSEFTSSLLVAQDVIATVDDFRVLDQTTSFGTESDFISTLEKTGMDLGDKTRRKQLLAIYPKVKDGTVAIQVGTASSIGESYKWSNAVLFDPSIHHKVNIRQNGLYLGIRITGKGEWRLTSYDMDVKIRGVR